MSDHWHIATGLAGYGPDAPDDGFDTATTPEQLAESVRAELQQVSESDYESANALADMGEFKEAWETLKNSDAADTLAANLNDTRADAPMYKDRPDLWRAEILRLVGENFPLDYNSGRTRLYVWQCEEVLAECESTPEEIRAEAADDGS